MCSMYWSLKDVVFNCPKCGALANADLQTHFMGEVGSCVNYYKVGERIPELAGIKAATIGEKHSDALIGCCDKCEEYVDLGFMIEDEAVVEVWPEDA